MFDQIKGFVWFCSSVVAGVIPVLFLVEVAIDAIRRLVTVD